MSDFSKCKICGDYDFLDKHKCNPKFEVNNPESMDDDEWQTFHALDHEEAAEKYGKYYNQDEYDLMNNEIIINVRKSGEDEIIKIAVSAEPDVNYHTSIIKNQEKNHDR